MRRHSYLVGYKGEYQVVYGEQNPDSIKYSWIKPLTLPEAKKLSKEIRGSRGPVVYKLVEVKLNKK